VKVAAIWRYPVKSMAGERLYSISIDANGVMGDRVVQVTTGAVGSQRPGSSRACCD
jgi:uncharacterized protein YcbX